LRARTLEYQEKLKDQFIKHALENIVSGKFQAKCDRVIDWTEIRKGHEAMENN